MSTAIARFVDSTPRFQRIPWRVIALVATIVPSAALSAAMVVLLFLDGPYFDWWTITNAADLMYEWGTMSPMGEAYSYRYSPLFAWAIVPFAELGLGVWRALHLAALAFLPRRIALATLLFAPFWYDVLHGNVMTFVAVAGFLAYRGNRWATIAYFAWCVLVPRPLMLPLAAWIVWQRPQWRWPAAGFAAIGIATLLFPGYLDALLASRQVTSIDNLAPSAWIGVAWIPIGLALGAWLTWRGRVGMAALAVSPYVLPYYAMTLLWEIRAASVSRPSDSGSRPLALAWSRARLSRRPPAERRKRSESAGRC